MKLLNLEVIQLVGLRHTFVIELVELGLVMTSLIKTFCTMAYHKDHVLSPTILVLHPPNYGYHLATFWY